MPFLIGLVKKILVSVHLRLKVENPLRYHRAKHPRRCGTRLIATKFDLYTEFHRRAQEMTEITDVPTDFHKEWCQARVQALHSDDSLLPSQSQAFHENMQTMPGHKSGRKR